MNRNIKERRYKIKGDLKVKERRYISQYVTMRQDMQKQVQKNSDSNLTNTKTPKKKSSMRKTVDVAAAAELWVPKSHRMVSDSHTRVPHKIPCQ